MLGPILHYMHSPDKVTRLTLSGGQLQARKVEDISRFQLLLAKFGFGNTSFKRVCEYIKSHQETFNSEYQSLNEVDRKTIRDFVDKVTVYNRTHSWIKRTCELVLNFFIPQHPNDNPIHLPTPMTQNEKVDTHQAQPEILSPELPSLSEPPTQQFEKPKDVSIPIEEEIDELPPPPVPLTPVSFTPRDFDEEGLQTALDLSDTGLNMSKIVTAKGETYYFKESSPDTSKTLLNMQEVVGSHLAHHLTGGLVPRANLGIVNGKQGVYYQWFHLGPPLFPSNELDFSKLLHPQISQLFCHILTDRILSNSEFQYSFSDRSKVISFDKKNSFQSFWNTDENNPIRENIFRLGLSVDSNLNNNTDVSILKAVFKSIREHQVAIRRDKVINAFFDRCRSITKEDLKKTLLEYSQIRYQERAHEFIDIIWNRIQDIERAICHHIHLPVAGTSENNTQIWVDEKFDFENLGYAPESSLRIPHQVIATKQLNELPVTTLDTNWNLNDFFGHISVINLDDRTASATPTKFKQRLEQIEADFNKIGSVKFKRLRATHGASELSQDVWSRVDDNSFNLSGDELDRSHKAQAGCLMSHKRIIEEAFEKYQSAQKQLLQARSLLANNQNETDKNQALQLIMTAEQTMKAYSSILILEDDSRFGFVNPPDTQNPHATVEMCGAGVDFRHVMKELPEDWDMLYFNTAECGVTREWLKGKPRPYSERLNLVDYGLLTNAIAINHHAYPIILKALRKIDDPNVLYKPVDHEYAQLHLSMKTFTPKRPLAYQAAGDSSISGGSSNDPWNGSWHRGF